MDVERARTVKGWLPRRLGENFFSLLPPFDNFFDTIVGFYSVASISISAKYPWTLIMRASYLGETKKTSKKIVKWIDSILLSQTSTFFHGSIQDSPKVFFTQDLPKKPGTFILPTFFIPNAGVHYQECWENESTGVFQKRSCVKNTLGYAAPFSRFFPKILFCESVKQ